MKLNKANHKVAVFSIAALALTASAGVTINNLVLSRGSSDAEYSVFAAEVKSGVTATGNLSHQTARDGNIIQFFDGDIVFNIDDISKFTPGDYIEFSTENMAIGSLDNREFRHGNLIIAKAQRVSNEVREPIQRSTDEAKFAALKPEESGVYQTYRIVFNDNIKDMSGPAKIEIDFVNSNTRYAMADHDYNATAKIVYDGSTVVQDTVNIRGYSLDRKLGTDFGNVYSGTSDGETIEYMNSYLWLRTQNHDEKILVGDIVEYTLDPNSGVAFNLSTPVGGTITSDNTEAFSAGKNNQYGVYYVDATNKVTYEVVENSPHKIVLKVVEAPRDDNFIGNIQVAYNILDTSPETIDYDNQQIREFSYEHKWLRSNGDVVFQRESSRVSDVTGATLKAYGSIKKRGSIIRKIQDQNGNKIAGFESDKLIYERMQEGTAYEVPAPEIKGYTFKGLGDGSVPQKGSITDGTHNVILVYTLNTVNTNVPFGGTPNPKDHIPNFDEIFPGCEVRYKDEIDTTRPGAIDAKIIISCPDQPDREYDVKINIGEPETAPQTIKVGETPDPKVHIPDFDEKFPGCEVRYKDIIDNTKPGEFDVTLVISCPDKEDFELTSKLIILEDEKIEETPAPKAEPKKEIEAPHTGFEKAERVMIAVFSGLSTFAILGSVLLRKK